jgi:hypothetical protein
MSLKLAAGLYIYRNYALKKKKKKRRRWRVTLHVHTCSGRNRIISSMRRPNTDSAPNKPVTLPRIQLLIRYVVMSPVPTVTIRCYGTRWRYKCVTTLTLKPWIKSHLLFAGIISSPFSPR